MEYSQLHELFVAQTEQMTAGERMAAYFAGEEVDCIPYFFQGDEEAIADVLGYTTAQWRDNPEAHIDIMRRRRSEFGLEGLWVGQRLRTVGEAVGSTIRFPEVGIDRVAKHAIERIDQLGSIIDNDPFTNPVYLGLLERAHILKDAFPEMEITTSVAGPFTVASTIMPMETLLRDTRKHPKEVHELLDFAVYHSVAWVEMFAREFGSCSCGIADPASSAGILSRKQYQDFSFPAQEKLVAGLTEAMGMAPSLHICGKTSPLWDDIAKLKISSFSVDNCESMAELKERLGDTFVIVGNVPPVDVMLTGSIDDVFAACRQCIAQAADSPCGYFLSTGCQVPIGTPRANLEAFIYAARTYGRGAKKGALPKGLEDNILEG